MSKSRQPKIDSIKELADFWDTHDLTGIEEDLEEVTEPVFARGSAIEVRLRPPEVKALEQMARAKGVSREELVRGWVLEHLPRRNKSRPANRSS